MNPNQPVANPNAGAVAPVREPKPTDLTEDQKAVLSTVYGYSDKANYTKEEIELAKKMFDTPEKFALLRKILQVLTPEERGLHFPRPEMLVDASPLEREKFAYAVAVDSRADEKIRQTLAGFYQLLKGEIRKDLQSEFEAQNQKDFEEKQKEEEYKEKVEEDERTVGKNL